MLDKAAKEFEYDCKIRHLSPKTIDNYGKQLRYLQRFLEKEFSISSIEDVKPSHIKRFLAMMDDAGRKPQYINDGKPSFRHRTSRHLLNTQKRRDRDGASGLTESSGCAYGKFLKNIVL